MEPSEGDIYVLTRLNGQVTEIQGWATSYQLSMEAGAPTRIQFEVIVAPEGLKQHGSQEPAEPAPGTHQQFSHEKRDS